MKNILLTVIAVCFVLQILTFWDVIAKAEKAECLKWQRHAETYTDFYLTEWQSEQCAEHGIEIDAPVT